MPNFRWLGSFALVFAPALLPMALIPSANDNAICARNAPLDEKSLYRALRQEKFANFYGLRIWAGRVEDRTLFGVVIEFANSSTMLAREAEFRLDANRGILMLRTRDADLMCGDTQAWFDDHIWEMPLPTRTDTSP